MEENFRLFTLLLFGSRCQTLSGGAVEMTAFSEVFFGSLSVDDPVFRS